MSDKPLKNPKHEAFAQYLYGGLTQDDAYKRAGYKGHSGAANRLAQTVSICERVAFLQERKAKQADITVEGLTKLLVEAHQAAVDSGDNANRRQCVMDLAKLNGLIVDKSKVETDNVTWIASDGPMPREEYERTHTQGVVEPSAGSADEFSSLPN